MNPQRKANSPYVKSVRPMTRDDLQFLREKSARPVIQKLRESHHIVARLLASGLSLNEVAVEVGYSVSRVSTLKNTPAMQELIAKYRDDDTVAWRKERDLVYEGMHSGLRKLVLNINDELDENIQDMPIGMQLKLMDSFADRVGYHRKSTKENINMDFAASLERAIAARDMKVIDHE